MKWDDQDIDKLFQNASENHTPVFKEEYWSKFENSLPPKKSKRKVGFFWWVFSANVLAFFLFGLGYLRHGKDELARDAAVQKNQVSQSKFFSNSQRKTKVSENKVQAKSRTSEVEIVQKPTLAKNLAIAPLKQEIGVLPEKIASAFDEKLIESLNGNSLVVENSIAEQLTVLKEQQAESNELHLELRSLNTSYEVLAIAPFLQVAKLKRPQFYMELGGNLGQSPIKNLTSTSNFYSGFSVGVGLMKSNRQNWNWSAGLNIAVNTYSNLQINKRTKVYGFGVQNFERKINYKQLFQLEFPLFVGKSIHKHNFQLGVVPSVLLGTRLNYAIVKDQITENHNSVYGFRDGLKFFTLKPSLRYAYQILPTWQIGMSIQIQALSAINSDVFVGELSKHPLNGHIFIRKAIFK